MKFTNYLYLVDIGSIVDVLIDAAGGLIGILILWFTTKLILGMEYKAKEDLERSGKKY
jgi:hypothetical protein